MASQKDRMAGALWGLVIGDALGVPVHWYYDPDRLKEDYGEITGYVDCKHPHRESFMKEMPYDGSIDILHDKRQFFNVKEDPFEEKSAVRSEHGHTMEEGAVHYHNGLKAGDNTCDIYLMRALLRHIVEKKEYREDAFLELFRDFFSTPGSHPDTYLSGYIRLYFQNLSQDGTKPYNAAPRQVTSWGVCSAVGMLGGFVPALLNHKRPTQAVARAVHHISLTARSENLSTAALILCPLVLNLIKGEENAAALKEACEQVRLNKLTGPELTALYAKHKGPQKIPGDKMWRVHTEQKDDAFDPSKYFGMTDLEFAREVSATACYTEYAVPTILYLASKYPKEFEKVLLINTNFGGDTTARNSLLGVVMGAAVGKSGIPKHLIEGLVNREAIEKEINDFVELCYS